MPHCNCTCRHCQNCSKKRKQSNEDYAESIKRKDYYEKKRKIIIEKQKSIRRKVLDDINKIKKEGKQGKKQDDVVVI